MARRSYFIRKSGPYRVTSYSQNGDGQVFLVIQPRYPHYGIDWPESRAHGHGGGPGIFTSMDLGRELAEFLNAPYSEEVVKEWDKHKVSTEAPWGPSFKHEFTGGVTVDVTSMDNLVCDRCDQRFRKHIFGACPDTINSPKR